MINETRLIQRLSYMQRGEPNRKSLFFSHVRIVLDSQISTGGEYLGLEVHLNKAKRDVAVATTKEASHFLMSIPGPVS